MMIVPLQALPNQTVLVQLSNQSCTINVQQMAYGLFLALYVGPYIVVLGAPCQNLRRIVHDAYLGFLGDLVFNDTQGTSDPIYAGLGGIGSSRFQLCYVTPADLAAFGLAG
jgi:hypothetical protein